MLPVSPGMTPQKGGGRRETRRTTREPGARLSLPDTPPFPMTTPHPRSPRPAAPPPGRQGEPRAAATIRKEPSGGGGGRARAGGAGAAGAMAQQVEQLRADGVDKEVLREGTGPLPDFRDGTKVRSAGERAEWGMWEAERGGAGAHAHPPPLPPAASPW